MNKAFSKYIHDISAKFSHKETTEYGYRTDFEILLNDIFASIAVKRIDHDAKAKEGNKPDFVILQHNVPLLYIEAKDIGVSLDKVEKSEQMARYYGYANLVLTDYVEFRFYRNGVRYQNPIKIAEYDSHMRTLTPLPENYENVSKTLVDFAQSHKEPIRSGEHLAKIMGGKARRVRDNIRQILSDDTANETELNRIYATIKKLLVHDLTPQEFSDMYAQTLVYGLFVARYHDDTPNTFSRQEARDLMPKSNPLLSHFFDHIVGPDFDKRLEYIVNELCEVFTHANIQELMHQYFEIDLWGKKHDGPDPVIHFYEDFLREYDPELRKKMGAFYTPAPVVRFIVRSLDYILENTFALAGGLSNSAKTSTGKHRVQVLDPAVGTGTFLTEILRNIVTRFKGQEGRWPTYVHHDLLPRLHGFELMMAPYTIAHLKMGLVLKETGFQHFHRRLGIYLTNSLEEASTQDNLYSGFGFAESIAEESKEAQEIKNHTPIMVVVGNPPYSAVSSNETDYANSLVQKYKVEPGGQVKLQERKHWLNDDYVKFIAFAEDMVAKTGEGVIGFITNHGYLDNPTFRGMRWHLMDTFDKIYIVDLHGNLMKHETPPDGGKDVNVFNIQQGVSIMLAVKTGKKVKGELASIQHLDIWGTRESKFEKLDDLSIETASWQKLSPHLPNLVFIPEHALKPGDTYTEGFSIDDLFREKATGVVTARDALVISDNKTELLERITMFANEDYTDTEIRERFFPGKKDGKYLGGDSRGWKLSEARKTIHTLNHEEYVKDFLYRPFDTKAIYYHKKMVDWGREKTFKHLTDGENIGLLYTRQAIGGDIYSHILVTRCLADNRVFFSNKGIPIEAPLYLYHDSEKISNLNCEIVRKIDSIVGETQPEDVIDYVYSVLHSPSYRIKYAELLKTDFPRIPYPTLVNFKPLVALGRELRGIHLMEDPRIGKYSTTYPNEGSNLVEKITYHAGKVSINKEQHFGNVPQRVWEMFIGGYQPAQKWLKDRKGKSLINIEIEHYQKIITVLQETQRVMAEIEKINI